MGQPVAGDDQRVRRTEAHRRDADEGVVTNEDVRRGDAHLTRTPLHDREELGELPFVHAHASAQQSPARDADVEHGHDDDERRLRRAQLFAKEEADPGGRQRREDERQPKCASFVMPTNAVRSIEERISHREGIRASGCRGLGRIKHRAEMPQTEHIERHFTASERIRDVVIGMSDGLTVPFALAAGLSGAVASTGIIVTAGLAEIAAGSIAMGLGGYLAARSDAEHYESERSREVAEVIEKPELEEAEVREIFQSYGISDEEATPLVRALQRNPRAWVDFMMRFELGLERPNPRRALQSAVTIGVSYIAGGLIPLFSYIVLPNVHEALMASIAVTLVALFIFGYVKGSYTGARPMRSALQTVLIGGLAAAAAFGLARLVSR